MRQMLCGLAVTHVLLVAAPPEAAAQFNTTCPNAYATLPGEIKTQVIPAGFPFSRFYKVPVVAGRSYSVFSWAPGAPGSGFESVALSLSFFTDPFCVSGLGAFVSSANDEPAVTFAGHNGASGKFISNFTGTLYVQVMKLNFSATEIRTWVRETTMFSPWWFSNPAGGFNAFILVRNNTNQALQYTITVYTMGGLPCAVAPGALGPNATNAYLIQPPCAPGSGSAQIAHYGAPGAISANMSTINGATSLVIDSPFGQRELDVSDVAPIP